MHAPVGPWHGHDARIVPPRGARLVSGRGPHRARLFRDCAGGQGLPPRLSGANARRHAIPSRAHLRPCHHTTPAPFFNHDVLAPLSVVSMQWRRDQPHARMALPERLVAIAATADGAHIAGGAESGRIYLWEACSGTLFLMCVRACTVGSRVFTSSLFHPTWSPHSTLPTHLPVRRCDAAILGGALQNTNSHGLY